MAKLIINNNNYNRNNYNNLQTCFKCKLFHSKNNNKIFSINSRKTICNNHNSSQIIFIWIIINHINKINKDKLFNNSNLNKQQ